LPTPTFYESIRAHLQGQYTRAWDNHGMLVLELAPQRVPRFEVVYHFLSPARMQRVRLKLRVDEHAAELPTLTHLYGSARYMEREVHEMYGIRFAGNADLRPILLYEGFEGHPLRKDYAMEHEQPIVPYRK
jgi:NADH-quinone oxidoreductase subunit C